MPYFCDEILHPTKCPPSFKTKKDNDHNDQDRLFKLEWKKEKYTT